MELEAKCTKYADYKSVTCLFKHLVYTVKHFDFLRKLCSDIWSNKNALQVHPFSLN